MKTLIFLILLFAGCSPNDWTAKLHMLKAEDYVTKAYQMKSQKVPYEKRMDLYRQACGEFMKAYEKDAKVFTLMRIEAAVDTFWKAEDKLSEEKFKAFQDTYIQAHPNEYEWGDTSSPMEM